MKSKFLLAVALLLALDATAALAQGRRGGGRRSNPGWGFQPLAHRAEITGYGGYFWHTSYDVRLNTPPPEGPETGGLDVKSNGFWGVEIDVNVRPGAQVALLYNRTDSELTFNPVTTIGGPGKRTLGDISVEYWHIGGLSGVAKGNIMPFGGLTLGMTRYASGGESEYKFSIMPQLGVKAFVNQRIGIRAQARLPITFLDGGFGLSFGSGGSAVAVGGTGVLQFDLSGGLMILI